MGLDSLQYWLHNFDKLIDEFGQFSLELVVSVGRKS